MGKKGEYNCEVCNSNTSILRGFGVISPWIRDLGATSRRATEILQCSSCGFSKFSVDYTDDGMQSLYSEYRGQHYTRVRTHWEPWYTDKFNEAHLTSWWLESRAKQILAVLEENNFAKLLPITHIVDVGGDTGELAVRLGSASFEIRELSDRPRVPSLKRGSFVKYDLAICSHVIEHVNEPFEFIENLIAEFPAIYIEVPYGVPRLSWNRRCKILNLLNLAATSHPLFWRALTEPSAGRRGNSWTPLRQSEHLSFFELGNIKNFVLSRWGEDVSVQESIGEILSPDGTKVKSISVFIQRADASR